MPHRAITKEGHRVHLFVAPEQYREIGEWIVQNQITLAKFCREAFDYYLQSKQKEINDRKLAQTCHVVHESKSKKLKQWLHAINP